MTTKTADLRPALRSAYLLMFDSFAVTIADAAEAQGLDTAEARALLKRLEHDGLAVSDQFALAVDVVFQSPETYDTISRATAIRRFDKVYPKRQPVEPRTGGTHKGATGPRYSDKQLQKGKAAREAGKSWVEVAKAAGPDVRKDPQGSQGGQGARQGGQDLQAGLAEPDHRRDQVPVMKRLALVVATLALAVPAAGASAHSSGPTPAEAISIADRWAAKDAPGLPNHCAGGRATITRSSAAVEREEALTGLNILGFADGWVWTGEQFVWDYTRCTWTTREELSPADQCAVDAHEQMHYVIGPEHVGPLDPRHPGPVECYTHSEPRPAARRKRARRTQAQINRSIRYRRTQARIKARAAMRRMHR